MTGAPSVVRLVTSSLPISTRLCLRGETTLPRVRVVYSLLCTLRPHSRTWAVNLMPYALLVRISGFDHVLRLGRGQ